MICVTEFKIGLSREIYWAQCSRCSKLEKGKDAGSPAGLPRGNVY